MRSTFSDSALSPSNQISNNWFVRHPKEKSRLRLGVRGFEEASTASHTKKMADKGDVSIDYIIKNCAAFKNGGCPYKDERLKGLAGKCPMFRDSKGNFICPFKERAANTYELRALMLEMKEKCPAKAAHSRFFQALMKINEKTAAKIGHCPYHQKGCKVNNIPVFDHSVAK
ncbi:uncharacterized protein LOC5518554 [Nematostella vectensis]|uniref:uncharacterized protein LOC5518554 n=1 Tax=Nematostella vectensis TaxID=45351 RepID=UPI0020773CDB|nr:uncharacterized protein LOC5518554 [Nematostella vectensis]